MAAWLRLSPWTPVPTHYSTAAFAICRPASIPMTRAAFSEALAALPLQDETSGSVRTIAWGRDRNASYSNTT